MRFLSDLENRRYEDLKYSLECGMKPSHRELMRRWGLRHSSGGINGSVYKTLTKLKEGGYIDWIAGTHYSMRLGHYQRCGHNPNQIVSIFKAALNGQCLIQYQSSNLYCVFKEIVKDTWGDYEGLLQDKDITDQFIIDEYKAYEKRNQVHNCIHQGCIGIAKGNSRICAYHSKKLKAVA